MRLIITLNIGEVYSNRNGFVDAIFRTDDLHRIDEIATFRNRERGKLLAQIMIQNAADELVL